MGERKIIITGNGKYVENETNFIKIGNVMPGGVAVQVVNESEPTKTEDVEDLMSASANSYPTNFEDAEIVPDAQESVPEEKDEPITGTKDDHVRLFVEAMKQMQQGVYCQTPFEPNIKNTYDWYAVCRLAIDIGIITSREEFFPLIDGDCWSKKPKGYQNFQKYIPAINKNSKYPVWQSGNGYENFYNKFKQIADQTYSIYKAKCEQAKIEPYK